MGDLDAPRATGELPARKVGALTRTSSQSSLPARKPMPAPVRAQTPMRSSAPISAGIRRDAPIGAKSSEDETRAIGARQAPVLAGKKLKKKVVVKKKV